MSEDKGKGTYKALLTGGSSGFNAVLGGGRSKEGEYARLEAQNSTGRHRRSIRAMDGITTSAKADWLSIVKKQSAFSVRCITE
jgi:hypothetical protein